MSNALCAGNGGGGNEGEFAWRKKKTSYTLGGDTFEILALYGNKKTELTVYDSMLISSNGALKFSNSHIKTIGTGTNVDGLFIKEQMGSAFVKCYGAIVDEGTDYNGNLRYGAYGKIVQSKAEQTGFVVDDNGGKYATGAVPPGEFVYENIS